jgi:glutaminyl-tRNA synthetase
MDNYLDYLNQDSLKVLKNIKCQKDILVGLTKDSRFQFERKGFFSIDKDSEIENQKIVWNLTVGLADSKGKK